MERKLLVAIGNTGLDKDVIHYLIDFFQEKEEVALHLISVIPLSGITESQRLLGDLESMGNSNKVATRKRQSARTHLQILEKMLIGAGFLSENIQSEAIFSMETIGPVLIQKSQTGLYDGIILGKRDLSLLQKMISGSISSELWKRNHKTPMWIINGRPQGRNILIPVNCSMQTLLAVDHLGFILQGNQEVDITLFHTCTLLTDEHIQPKTDFYEKWGKEWCDLHLQGDENGHFHFQATEQILKESGIPAQNIHRANIDRGLEPAQIIVSEVIKHHYSTIVMGRRQAKDKGVFQGVSDRVLANIHDIGLWVLG